MNRKAAGAAPVSHPREHADAGESDLPVEQTPCAEGVRLPLLPPYDAAMTLLREIAPPVAAATATTALGVAVIALVDGNIILSRFAATVAVTVTVVAMLPRLARRLRRR